MVKVVYFNQWFSQITDVIADIKKKHGDRVKVIGSSKTPGHVYSTVVDEFILEDWKEGATTEESMKNYIEWSLNICKQKHVDIFFVKKYADVVSKHRLEYAFNGTGTFLVCEDAETLELFNSKAEVYRSLLNNEVIKPYIPMFYQGNDKEYMKQIISDAREQKHEPMCLKLDRDEGGFSFRAIDNKLLDMKNLMKYRVNCFGTEEAFRFIDNISTEEFERLIFMEVLDSPEISVDCYKSKNGFISMCRAKINNTRIQRFYHDERISKVCEEIANHFNLRFPFNVQFRIKHGEDENKLDNLRLLEINPRMSGGTYYQLLLGLNMAEVCLLDMINQNELYNIKDYTEFDEKRVSHVETAILV